MSSGFRVAIRCLRFLLTDGCADSFANIPFTNLRIFIFDYFAALCYSCLFFIWGNLCVLCQNIKDDLHDLFDKRDRLFIFCGVCLCILFQLFISFGVFSELFI